MFSINNIYHNKNTEALLFTKIIAKPLCCFLLQIEGILLLYGPRHAFICYSSIYICILITVALIPILILPFLDWIAYIIAPTLCMFIIASHSTGMVYRDIQMPKLFLNPTCGFKDDAEESRGEVKK